MSIVTPNMGLTAWDLTTDPYDHSQLATNFSKIDLHRHIPGEGQLIPTAGITDSAVTTAKIANINVTTGKLADASVTQAKLAKPSVGTPELIDGSVTGAKIANGAIDKSKLDSSVSFVGDVRLWHRVDPAISPPAGWEIADGRPWSTVTNTMGPGGTNWTTGNMPDYRNKYILGAATSGTGGGTSTPPDIGQVVGAHTKDLSHTHTVNAHSHTVNAHSHTVNAHAHGGSTDVQGAHAHTFAGGLLLHSRQNAFLQGIQVKDIFNNTRSNSLQSAYAAGFNNGTTDDAFGMDAAGAHAHNIGTDAQSPGTSAATPGTDSQSPGTNSGGSATQDIRPGSVGTLVIMRVI